MVGVGFPVVEQFRDTCCPAMAFTSGGESTAVGGTVGVVQGRHINGNVNSYCCLLLYSIHEIIKVR